MGQGNIRIMAETPGIDISKDVEPTIAIAFVRLFPTFCMNIAF